MFLVDREFRAEISSPGPLPPWEVGRKDAAPPSGSFQQSEHMPSVEELQGSIGRAEWDPAGRSLLPVVCHPHVCWADSSNRDSGVLPLVLRRLGPRWGPSPSRGLGLCPLLRPLVLLGVLNIEERGWMWERVGEDPLN